MLAVFLIVLRERDREIVVPNQAGDAPRLTIATALDAPCGYEVVDGDGHAAGTVVTVTGQNESTAEVVVTGIRAELRSSSAATVRAVPNRRAGCPGDPISPRDFVVDLDEPMPRLAAAPPRTRRGSDAAPTTFPYRVVRGEPEVFSIELSTGDCDCRVALVVEWVANGERRSTTAGDFRVVPR
ncbi:hypothetical protein [Lentzea sp. NPDC092896]|uniref:hypothetical protein n=1 Tax=Lentzea sp. NPDC092896 TaxID=3364127 RepID=UPI00380D0867